MHRLIAPPALALTLLATSALAQTAAWSFRSAVDPITDARRGIASIESREEITRRLSSSEVLNTAPASIHSNPRYMLVVKCDFAVRGVYVSLSTPRGLTRRSSTVTQRFDAGTPTSAVWSTGTGSLSLFDQAEVLAFTTQAKRANRIALRIADTDGEGSPDTVTFSGVGAARAIDSVYAACARPA